MSTAALADNEISPPKISAYVKRKSSGITTESFKPMQ